MLCVVCCVYRIDSFSGLNWIFQPRVLVHAPIGKYGRIFRLDLPYSPFITDTRGAAVRVRVSLYQRSSLV